MQDYALAQTSQIAMAVATEGSFMVLPHPPYFPDLLVAPSDFYLFPNPTNNARGTCSNLGSNEGVIDVVDEYLGNQEEGFHFEGISKLEQRRRKCIETKGDY